MTLGSDSNLMKKVYKLLKMRFRFCYKLSIYIIQNNGKTKLNVYKSTPLFFLFVEVNSNFWSEYQYMYTKRVTFDII